MKFNSKNEAITELMTQLYNLRYHESKASKTADSVSSKTSVEVFVTFHNGNSWHNDSVNTTLIEISRQIA